MKCNADGSEAHAVDDGCPRLLVVAAPNPVVLEGGHGGQDGSSDPHRELALGGCRHLDLHRLGGQLLDLAGQSLGQVGEHRGAARQNYVGVELLAHVQVALLDGVEGDPVNALDLLADVHRLEQGLRAPEELAAQLDDLTVRQLELLRRQRILVGFGHLCLVVLGHVTQVLLNFLYALELAGLFQVEADLVEQFLQVVGQVPSCEVGPLDGMGHGVAFVDGHGVGHPVARVQDQAPGAPRGVEGEHGLDGHVVGGDVERLEHDFGHFLAVGLGIPGGLGEHGRVLVRHRPELVVVDVFPNELHLVPVGHDPVFDRVLEGKHSPLRIGLLADEDLGVPGAEQDAGHLGPTDDGGEGGGGSVVAGKAALAHAAAVVDDDCLVLLSHYCLSTYLLIPAFNQRY